MISFAASTRSYALLQLTDLPWTIKIAFSVGNCFGSSAMISNPLCLSSCVLIVRDSLEGTRTSGVVVIGYAAGLRDSEVRRRTIPSFLEKMYRADGGTSRMDGVGGAGLSAGKKVVDAEGLPASSFDVRDTCT